MAQIDETTGREVTVTLPDGSTRTFPTGSTALDVARSISPRLADAALGAKVDGKLVDLNRPIDRDATVAIVTFDSPEGPQMYWHSTSHLMAEAVTQLFPGAKFGVGPAVEGGFYYDMDLGDHRLTQDDLTSIEVKMRELSAADEPITCTSVPRREAIARFEAKGDEYKVEILTDPAIAGGQETVTLYTQGDFTDLCRGPHVPSTGKIKAVKLLSISGSYWRGDEKRGIQLQRVYGVSYPKQKQLDEHLFRLEEAKRRDHRKLGRELELFMLIPEVGQGLPIWLPKGAILRETLENYLKVEQRRRGYLPVITPHIGNLDLYRTSGHYPYYADSQFDPIKVEDEQYMLKPMNCPHHCMIYASKPRSYRDLPVRLAEFGTVYRYEKSGQLSGLTRVRSFTQDDAHLFVRPDQVREEMTGVLELMRQVMTVLGFEQFTTRLSFRDPANKAKFVGSDELWATAEADILAVAQASGLEYTVGLGEGAFYGPKIDFIVKDALGREWQLGTVQVDYNLPERFDLTYTAADGSKQRPVMIHRAPFGSLERFIGVLIEHFAGNFPLWLAPVQVAVLPITDAAAGYAAELQQRLSDAGLRSELDGRNEKIGYKIREAELMKIPYMLVVGAKEAEAGTVSVRRHGLGDEGSMSADALIERLLAEVATKAMPPEPVAIEQNAKKGKKSA